MTCYTVSVSGSSPPTPGNAPVATRYPAALAFVGVSAVLHGLGLWSLSAVDMRSHDDEETPYEFEIDIAPEAPEAPDPGAEDDEPVVEPDPEPDPDTNTAAIVDPVIKPDVAPEPEPDPVVDPIVVVDAGASDAAVETPLELDAGVADAGPDAGVFDAGSASAVADAGPRAIDAGTPLVATSTRDGGSAGRGDAGPRDAGTAVASSSDAGANVGPKVVGVGVDLAALTPPKDHLAVVIRFDRMRGTEWAERTEAILAPMPDYRLIIGERKIPIARSFDLLMISTSNPRDVTATNLATRTAMGPEATRKFLEHKDLPIAWSPVQGGALGKLGRSPFVAPDDPRVYLTPLPSWVLLVDPKHVGKLATPRPGSLDLTPGDDSLPVWVQKLPKVAAMTGTTPSFEGGPAVAVSARGLPAFIDVPLVARLPAPRHFTVGLWMHQNGLIARGTMQFASDKKAATFVTRASAAQKSLLGSKLKMLALQRFNGFYAVKNLSFRRVGSRVSYATSVSTADGIAMTKAAAAQATSWYSRKRAPDPAPAPTPAPNKSGGIDAGPGSGSTTTPTPP